jgi:hypothetical protein
MRPRDWRWPISETETPWRCDWRRCGRRKLRCRSHQEHPAAICSALSGKTCGTARTLWKSRAFAAVSIATLGLGIGAATSIFSVIHNVLLEPFPEKGAARTVFLRIHNTEQSQEVGWESTAAEVLEFGESNRVFDGITGKRRAGAVQAWRRHRVVQRSARHPEHVRIFRDALQGMDGALWGRSLDDESDFRAERDAPDTRRHYAVAFCLVWS